MNRQLLVLTAAVASLAAGLALAPWSSAAQTDRVHLRVNTKGIEGTMTLSTPQGWSTTCTVAGFRRCDVDVERGQVMTMTPAGTTASPFLRWDPGPCAQWTPACTVTIGDSLELTAMFSTRLVLPVFGRGSLSWESYDGSKAEVWKCRGWTGSETCLEVPWGQKLRLRATASSGSRMTGWGGSCSVATVTQNCILVMDANRVATGSFEPNPAPGASTCGPNQSCDGVTVTVPFYVKVVGAGSVTAARVRVVGTKTCESYTSNGYMCSNFAALRDTWIEVRAVAVFGGRFLGWSGPCVGTGVCRFKPRQSWLTLTAQFG